MSSDGSALARTCEGERMAQEWWCEGERNAQEWWGGKVFDGELVKQEV